MSDKDCEEFDVAIIGGGPGGSSLAALAAMQNLKVIVLEKEKFPRYQIGESLLPSTIQGICQLTGVADELARAGFVTKQGGTYLWGTNPEPWTFSFSVSPRMNGKGSYAYQVERSKFDQILLDHARRLGADVRESCSADHVLIDDGRVTGVSFLDGSGKPCNALAKYVVDASGNRSKLYKYVGGSRIYSDFFRNVAIFGYFRNGKRLPPPRSGNILSAAFNSGWFWYIPLTESLTSVGAVIRRELAGKVQGDPEGALKTLIAECPMIQELLSDAERITDGDYGKIRVRKDYSYHNTQFWRPGMALIGDAACFIDPVFSTGVHLSTYSALLVARSINSVLGHGMDEAVAFREFERRYRREFSLFYEFLMYFYDSHVGEQSYFWSAKKITQNTQPELESFVDLVGGLSSGEASLTSASELMNRFATRSIEYRSAVDELTTTNERDMLPIYKSSIVRESLSESAQIQSLANLGHDAKRERPLFPDGLVASANGMFWERSE
jgi:FAD-dependent halogenase